MILCLGSDGNGHAACHAHEGIVTDECRLNHEDFITRIDHGADGDVDRLGAADGNDDLMIRVVVGMHGAGQIPRNGPAQVCQPRIGGVDDLLALKHIDSFLADAPRGGKIRLAHAQADDALHRGSQIEEAADAGRLQSDNALG